MGSFSILHWLIVLVVFIGIPALVVMLVMKATKRRARSPLRSTSDGSLRELADLRDKNLLSEAEFQSKRAEILRQL